MVVGYSSSENLPRAVVAAKGEEAARLGVSTVDVEVSVTVGGTAAVAVGVDALDVDAIGASETVAVDGPDGADGVQA